jgi:uncharacterized SAM-binding protein YcdF (DUF218 family)
LNLNYSIHFFIGLLLPPSGPILLALLALLVLRCWPRCGLSLLVAAVLLIYLSSSPYVANLLTHYLQSHPPLAAGIPVDSGAGAIVVLGGGLYSEAPEYRGDTVNLRTLGRLRYAAKLARESQLPVLVSGGYAHKDGLPEGDLMQQILTQEFGIAPVWVENTSRNTWENAVNSADLLRARRIDTIVLVTHAVHMPRAVAAFRRTGLQVIPAPTLFFPGRLGISGVDSLVPSEDSITQIWYSVYERVGQVWYWCRSALPGEAADSAAPPAIGKPDGGG